MRIPTMSKPNVRLTLLTVTSILFLAACGKEQVRKATVEEDYMQGGVLRLAAQQPMSLDPIHSRNYWESEIVLQLFDSLLKFDANLNIIPGLAQDWHISSDGRTYTFNLRDDVQFHNGRKLI